jgi:DNA polymerase-4/DNA polymerase V
MCFFQRTSFPTAIAHIDCNAFFASVEEAYNPSYRGKPLLVAGMGASCVITASYAARKYHISTGTPVWEARKICPEAIVVPADFRKYLLYHQNFLKIIGEFTPDIEAASIDECYIDLKGLRRLYRKPYAAICQDIQAAIKSRLGIGVSIGLSTSKVLAKVASNYKKPNGLTVVSGKDIEKFLRLIPIDKIKGLGTNSRALLAKQGINTTMEFVLAPPDRIQKLLGKPGVEMQLELRGFSVRPVVTESALPKSLARTRSFTVTRDRSAIYRELLKNLALAFWHLRKSKLKTSHVTLMLRTRDYKTYGEEIRLPEDLNCEGAIVGAVKKAFEKLYQPGWEYRSSGIITTSLRHEDNIPLKLFPNELETDKQLSLFEKIDRINDKYGALSISMAGAVISPPDPDRLEKLNLPFLGRVT